MKMSPTSSPKAQRDPSASERPGTSASEHYRVNDGLPTPARFNAFPVRDRNGRTRLAPLFDGAPICVPCGAAEKGKKPRWFLRSSRPWYARALQENPHGWHELILFDDKTRRPHPHVKLYLHPQMRRDDGWVEAQPHGPPEDCAWQTPLAKVRCLPRQEQAARLPAEVAEAVVRQTERDELAAREAARQRAMAHQEREETRLRDAARAALDALQEAHPELEVLAAGVTRSYVAAIVKAYPPAPASVWQQLWAGIKDAYGSERVLRLYMAKLGEPLQCLPAVVVSKQVLYCESYADTPPCSWLAKYPTQRREDALLRVNPPSQKPRLLVLGEPAIALHLPPH